jgi:glycerol-3-phosphate acyltransferase PlsX
MVTPSRRIRVAVDTMGGDYAPGDIVKGAVLAAGKGDVDIALVGPTDIVEAELAKYDASGLPIRCVRADEFVKEDENPALAVRRKPNASIAVATRMVKAGEADGLISAGSTGAIVSAAIQHLGMIEGIERPVIGGVIFDPAPKTVVFDLGVNIDCKPYHLLTFAIIGAVFCQKLLDIANPTVGLLNIGTEESKGNQLTRESYHLLKGSGLNFIGNIEGNELMSGRANVIVCDAFVGNVVFKLIEKLGLFKDSPERDEKSILGGGLILGVNGIVRKIHGASRAPHVAVKIRHTKQAIEADLIGAIKSELATFIKESKV